MIRVLLVDDHKMIRQGLRTLLKQQPDIDVVGEVSNGREALQSCQELALDVVVMDVNMPDLNGVDATRQLTASGKGPKVVALTAQGDHRTAAVMLQAGAAGYVLKEDAVEELVTAIRAVVAGNVYMSERLTSDAVLAQMHASNAGGATAGLGGTLTPREREVLQLIAEGRATKEAAAQLQVSVKTIETHRRNLMEKLHVASVAELTKYAIREGISFL